VLRHAFTALCTTLWLSLQSGCVGSPESTEDCAIESTPEIRNLKDRYALGSNARITLYGADTTTIESSNPDVMQVGGINGADVRLHFVGVGQATLVATNSKGTAQQTLEVAEHTGFMVLRSLIAFPVGQLDEQVLLAGQQCFTVIYFDATGQLYGKDLARVRLPVGTSHSYFDQYSDETYCMDVEEPGPHVLEVAVGNDERSFTFTTVPEEDIVAVELLAPNEADLLPGSIVRVDAVGLTDDGTEVSGIWILFRVDDDGAYYPGYFSYEYQPDAPAAELSISHILDSKFDPRMTFHGVPQSTAPLECAAIAWRKGGPLPGVAFLLSLVLALRVRRRRDT
jgi:hypothetical protein